jgi:sigma-B regulation protein RsbU (phosphoserine phosphatase)
MSEGDEHQRLTAASEDFQDLYENAPCGYLSIQLDGKICGANATLASWTGYTAEQLIGMRFRDLLTVGTRILYETNFAPLLNMQGRAEEISFDILTATGIALPVSASGALRKDGSGRVISTRMILIRAAERRRYEHQLIEERRVGRELEVVTKDLLKSERETSVLREQFIAVLGHDLRNPLASISAGVRLLTKNPPADRQKDLLEMVQGSVVRMAALIDNVLDFARGRLGAGIPLELRPDVLLPPLLEQVVSELRIGVPDHVIETDFHLPRPIKCDPLRIGQLVSNLLANALTHGSPKEPVRLHAEDANDELVVWIANGGPTISEAAMQRLFHPFFRGEVRASQQGLGLGLHIASEIAKAHCGTLTVASSDVETRFTFRMPLEKVASLASN